MLWSVLRLLAFRFWSREANTVWLGIWMFDAEINVALALEDIMRQFRISCAKLPLLYELPLLTLWISDNYQNMLYHILRFVYIHIFQKIMDFYFFTIIKVCESRAILAQWGPLQLASSEGNERHFIWKIWWLWPFKCNFEFLCILQCSSRACDDFWHFLATYPGKA